MMNCPRCNYQKIKTTNIEKGLVNKRFKKCQKCNHNFVTVEVLYVDTYWIEYIKNLKQSGELDITKRDR